MNNSPSPPRSMDSSSPPRSHRGRKPFSPTVESLADADADAESTVSSDHTSHGFFSPKEEFRSSPQPHEPTPSNSPEKIRSPHLSPVFISNRSVRDEPAVMTKVDPNPHFEIHDGVVEEGHDGGGGGRRPRPRPSSSASKRMSRKGAVSRALLGFRVCGLVLCLISFSVMAADKNQGWALDSFDRYKEFRYCMAVNVIGFVYSGAQASDVAYHLATGNYYVPHHSLRYYFDFFMDQVLSYLLISSSSSAATRVEDWKSNWGEDKFPQMASASIALSFLAFVALASSSLLSGYGLCTLRSST